jgi:hypothetical protein
VGTIAIVAVPVLFFVAVVVAVAAFAVVAVGEGFEIATLYLC